MKYLPFNTERLLTKRRLKVLESWGMFLSVFLKYIAISSVICLVFGLDILSTSIIKRIYKGGFKGSYLFQFWSLVLVLIVWRLNPYNIYFFKTDSLWNLRNIMLILICIIPTAIIVCVGRKNKPNQAFKIGIFINGASMEIPQRLLVQNLFVVLGVNTVIYKSITLGILLNSIIWVQFILIQEIINGNKISRKIVPEIFASFWFSIWVGVIYMDTGNILVAMLTHGLQRIITHGIRLKFGKSEINNAEE